VELATMIDLIPSIISKTIHCLESGIIKTLAAIHVASAMESGCDLFYSVDKGQCKIAEKMKLNVEFIGRD